MALLTQASYVLAYELPHLSYHLPMNHPIRRMPGHRWLAAQHASHHNPRRMHCNFNITVPLADWVLRTYRRPK